MGQNIPRIGKNSNSDSDARRENALRVHARLRIPLTELDFRFTRSGGPGGQHVNKTSTRVEILFSIPVSRVLTEVQKASLLQRLGPRADASGTVRVVEQRSRSQARNRALALEKLGGLLRDALRRPRERVPTRPPGAARERRLESKRKASETKRLRRRVTE